jgi:hypothetical protein
MRWRSPSRPRCSLVVLVAAAGHDGRRPAKSGPSVTLVSRAPPDRPSLTDGRQRPDVIYGSGLRKTPDGAPPNSGKLPSYFTMNLAVVQDWKNSPVGDLEGRVGVTSLYDNVCLLRDGSGVGVARRNTAEGEGDSPRLRKRFSWRQSNARPHHCVA